MNEERPKDGEFGLVFQRSCQPITIGQRIAARLTENRRVIRLLLHKATIAIAMLIVLGWQALSLPRILCTRPCAEGPTYWMTARQFSDEAYPRWRADNPGKRCPSSLATLTKYMNRDYSFYQEHGKDLYTMHCGEDTANVPNGFGVSYVGEDRSPHTEDDIKSWERAPKD